MSMDKIRQSLLRRLGRAAWAGAKRGWDPNDPLGLDPGTVTDLSNRGYLNNPISNLVLRGGLPILDALGRTMNAGIHGGASLAGQVAREFGESRSGARRLERDLTALMHVLPGVGRLPRPTSRVGAHRSLGNVTKHNVNQPVARNNSLASRNVSLYNLPDKPQRPIEMDYPHGIPQRADGTLTHDIDGRPLVARRIVGRQRVEQADRPLPPTQFDALATQTVGQGALRMAPGALGKGSVGATRIDRWSRLPKRIALSNRLSDRQLPKVYAHELGHVIDQAAGEIPVSGLSRELKPLYNILNTGQERTRHLTGPQHLGYTRGDVPREFMAEAIRAYLTNPNAMKTVAPKTAARIRKYVNEHPSLKHIIQFNTFAGASAAPMALDMLPPREDTWEVPISY